MDDLDKLKLLIKENEYPMFEDAELESFLEDAYNNVYLAASRLCLYKASQTGNKKVTVGPITVENSIDPDYWIKLSETYLTISKEVNLNSSNDNNSGKYIQRMRRY